MNHYCVIQRMDANGIRTNHVALIVDSRKPSEKKSDVKNNVYKEWRVKTFNILQNGVEKLQTLSWLDLGKCFKGCELQTEFGTFKMPNTIWLTAYNTPNMPANESVAIYLICPSIETATTFVETKYIIQNFVEVDDNYDSSRNKVPFSQWDGDMFKDFLIDYSSHNNEFSNSKELESLKKNESLWNNIKENFYSNCPALYAYALLPQITTDSNKCLLEYIYGQ